MHMKSMTLFQIFILLFSTTITYSHTMGLDILLVSKGKEDDQLVYSKLSREFCDFLCGPGVYDNSEFEQLQQLIQLDLSLFKSYPMNMEPDTGELEYRLYLAEEAKNDSEVKRIQALIEKEEREWAENYDTIHEGWMQVNELETLALRLITKLKGDPTIHRKLDYNFGWGDYFELKEKNPKDYSSYVDHTLIEDLLSLIHGLKEMGNKGAKYVTFDYG